MVVGGLGQDAGSMAARRQAAELCRQCASARRGRPASLKARKRGVARRGALQIQTVFTTRGDMQEKL
jgi:hypothetical protein